MKALSLTMGAVGFAFLSFLSLTTSHDGLAFGCFVLAAVAIGGAAS